MPVLGADTARGLAVRRKAQRPTLIVAVPSTRPFVNAVTLKAPFSAPAAASVRDALTGPTVRPERPTPIRARERSSFRIETRGPPLTVATRSGERSSTIV